MADKTFKGVKVLKEIPNSLAGEMREKAETPACQKLKKAWDKAVDDATKALTSLKQNEVEEALNANLKVFKTCAIKSAKDITPVKLVQVFLADVKMVKEFTDFWKAKNDVRKKLDKAMAARKAYMQCIGA